MVSSGNLVCLFGFTSLFTVSFVPMACRYHPTYLSEKDTVIKVYHLYQYSNIQALELSTRSSVRRLKCS